MSPLSRYQQQGFTLLELVLVMFIIALIASTPLLFIDEQDQQLRYEETLKKMEIIRRAIYNREVIQSAPSISGFVVDNGVLPEKPLFGNGLGALTNHFDDYDGNTGTADTDWQSYSSWSRLKMHTPYYNLGAASGALPSGFELRKGHRSRYIHNNLDSAGEIRDGWGVEFAFDSSSAIATPAESNGYTLGLVGIASGYGSTPGAQTTNFGGLEWQVALSDINIFLMNTSSAQVSGKELALLVFRNDASSASESNYWTTYHFPVNIPAASTDASGALIAYSKQSSKESTWSINGNPVSNASDTFIPAGQHLIVVEPEAAVAPETTKHQVLNVIPDSIQPSLTITVSP